MNAGFTTKINGLEQKESDDLLALLFDPHPRAGIPSALQMVAERDRVLGQPLHAALSHRGLLAA
ncbi:MAG: hypothetical protein WDM79_03570 [Terricaulis sp.]